MVDTISVVLCTYRPNRPLIERVFGALRAQRKVPLEIVVVDSANEPPLAGDPLFHAADLRVVREPRPGLANARARAVTVARGDLIVFVDDDNLLDDDYLERACDIFSADPQLALIGGAIEGEYEAPPKSWFYRFAAWIAVRDVPREYRAVSTAKRIGDHVPVGAGLCMRTALAQQYFAAESFDAELGRTGETLSSGEDLDVAMFALCAGWKVGVDGRLRLRHVIPTGRTSEAYLRRLQRDSIPCYFRINERWRRRAGGHVFAFCGDSIPIVAARLAAYTLLLAWPSGRLLAATNYYLLRELLVRR